MFPFVKFPELLNGYGFGATTLPSSWNYFYIGFQQFFSLVILSASSLNTRAEEPEEFFVGVVLKPVELVSACPNLQQMKRRLCLKLGHPFHLSTPGSAENSSVTAVQ